MIRQLAKFRTSMPDLQVSAPPRKRVRLGGGQRQLTILSVAYLDSRTWRRMLAIAAGAILFLASATASAASDAGPLARQGRWLIPAVSAPGVSYGTIMSSSARAEVSFQVYLPPEYAANDGRRYPTLYWLHGTGGGQRGLPIVAGIFDQAIRQGKIPPMIVVFPNGLPEGMWADSADGQAPVETMLVNELLPHIDQTYRTIADRRARILEGFSMGGYGAARIGFRHTNIFASISMLAAGPLDTEFNGPQVVDDPVLRNRLLRTVYGDDISIYKSYSPWMIAIQQADKIRGSTRIRQIVGSKDFTLKSNLDFHSHLSSLGVPHEFEKIDGVGHDVRGIFSHLGDRNWIFYNSALVELSSGNNSNKTNNE
jgi:enterochelin esterase-like enzyme